MKVGDISWVAAALMHVENPERTAFRPREVLARAVAEFPDEARRPGVQHHVHHHAVGNKPASPARLCFLYATPDGGRRLFRAADTPHPSREAGWTVPDRQDLPARYHHLLEWYAAGYGSTDLERLRRAARATLLDLPRVEPASRGGRSRPGIEPPAEDPLVRLARHLSQEFIQGEPRLVGTPPVPAPAHARRGRGQPTGAEPREWMVDFYLADQRSEVVYLPVLACESAVHAPTAAGPDPGEAANYRVHDSARSFLRLLHFRAPHLLYVARPGKERAAPAEAARWVQETERLLRRCAADYRSLWHGVCLYVMLLPASWREPGRVRVGAGRDGVLDFEPLSPTAVD
jgi:hypothetical protein